MQGNNTGCSRHYSLRIVVKLNSIGILLADVSSQLSSSSETCSSIYAESAPEKKLEKQSVGQEALSRETIAALCGIT